MMLHHTERKPVLTFIVFALLLLIGNRAHAGIADTPLPQLNPGETARHLFSAPGAVDTATLETVFTCTSLESAAIKVGVELFNSAGAIQNNAASGDGSLNVNPGQTVSFSTGAPAGLAAVDQTVTSFSGIGSARIVSTGKKVLCSARIVSSAGNPPTVLYPLTLTKSKKQSGD